MVVTTTTYNFYFFYGMILNPFCLLYFQLYSCSALQTVIPQQTNTWLEYLKQLWIFGNKAVFLHQENELYSNKLYSDKWLGLEDRWCGCKFPFLANLWLPTGHKGWNYGIATLQPGCWALRGVGVVCLHSSNFSRSDCVLNMALVFKKGVKKPAPSFSALE